MAVKKTLAHTVRDLIEQMVEKGEQPLYKTSGYIAETLDMNYSYISNIFSESFGYTIEQYLILCKINKAKQLLLSNESSISSIAMLLHYRSAAHFSSQFKELTGMSPSDFKKMEKETSGYK